MEFNAYQIENAWVYYGFTYEHQAVDFLRKKSDKKKRIEKRKELIHKIKQLIKLLLR